MHDDRVLRRSGQFGHAGNLTVVLMEYQQGISAHCYFRGPHYSLLQCVMILYSDHRVPGNRLNYSFSSCTMLVEWAFDRLKACEDKGVNFCIEWAEDTAGPEKTTRKCTCHCWVWIQESKENKEYLVCPYLCIAVMWQGSCGGLVMGDHNVVHCWLFADILFVFCWWFSFDTSLKSLDTTSWLSLPKAFTCQNIVQPNQFINKNQKYFPTCLSTNNYL